MSKWIEFKDGQYPRTGEIIVVKNNEAKESIYEYLVFVKKGPTTFVRYHDHSTILSFHGLSHWKLIDSPY